MLYLVWSKKTRYFKIGSTQGCVKKRMAALQVANPHELVLVATALGSIDDEFALHSKLSKCRVRGEWFDVMKIHKQRKISALEPFFFGIERQIFGEFTAWTRANKVPEKTIAALDQKIYKIIALSEQSKALDREIEASEMELEYAQFSYRQLQFLYASLERSFASNDFEQASLIAEQIKAFSMPA